VIRIYDPQPPPHPLGWTLSGTFVQPEVEAVLRAGVAHSGKAGIQHYFVENDEPKSPFEDIKVSYDYLSKLAV